MLLCYLKSYSNCCIIAFKRIETNEVFTFELSKKVNDFVLLLKFFNTNRNELIIGYNMENFYNIVFNFILTKYNSFINEKSIFIAYYIYNVASNVYSESIDKSLKYPKFYNCIDLLKILTSRDSAITLTEMEMYMNEPNIEDFKYTCNDGVLEYKIPELKEYCISKLGFLTKLYNEAKEKIGYRFALSKEYNLNLLNRYDSGVGKFIIEKSIINNDGISKEELFELKNKECKSFKLSDIVLKEIYFKTKEFNKLLSDIKDMAINDSIDEFKYIFNYKGDTFVLNNGGLEFKKNDTIYELNEGERMIGIDVSNAYPTLINKFKFYPDFLPKTFEDVFNHFYKNRIDKSKSKELTKIPLLGIIGNFNNQSSFLYSPQTYMKIVLNFKLAILMLLEELYLKGVEILYVKSDEVIFKLKDAEVALIIHEWKNRFGFTGLHLNKYSKIISLNINDMILYPSNYKEKPHLIETRGIFNPKSKNFGVNKNAPIISKCIMFHFGYNTSISDFINKETHVKDYLFYYKVNKRFKIITKKKNEDIEEGRIGRYFVCKRKNENKTYKYNVDKKTSVLLHDNDIVLNNDSFKKDEIDKAYYYHEVIKLKNIIQPLQQKLF